MAGAVLTFMRNAQSNAMAEQAASIGSSRRLLWRFLRSEEPGQARYSRVAAGVITGVAAKALGLLATLLTVRLTYHYLGPERYGIWVTMSSMLAWLTIMDLGIANGLTPALSEAFGKGRQDLAQQHVSTAFWSLVVAAVAMGTVALTIWRWIDWRQPFNIHSSSLAAEVSLAMAYALAVVLAGIPLSITQRIYLAYQEGALGNLWQIIGSVGAVVGVLLATSDKGGLPRLVLGLSGAQLLVSIASTAWLFIWAKPYLRPLKLPALHRSSRVLSLGGMFFVNQIGTLIIFQMDSIIISYYLGPKHVASYSVTWQLFIYANMITTLIASYLSPAFGEAYAKRETAWIRSALKKQSVAGAAFTIPVILIFALWFKPIISAWIGPGAVPGRALVLWMAAWSLLLMAMTPIVSVLVGVGRLRLYTALNVAATSLNLLLSVWLVQRVGVIGVIIASVVTTFLLLLIPSLFEIMRLLASIEATPEL